MQQLAKNQELNLSDEDINTKILFSFGNSLIIDNRNNEITLLNNNNETQLYIKVTAEGLIVNLNTEKLNIHANEELNLISKKINIKASEQLNFKSGGNLVQEIAKDVLTEVGGTNKQIAQVQKITATLGNAEIKANDYVKLDGESVLLNCEE